MKKLTKSVLVVVLTASFSVTYAQKAKVDTSGTKDIQEVVVTALGIKREKKALGYSTQSVGGEELSDKPINNFANALQGEVAGLNIQNSGTLGGSSNIIVRGFGSITGNNQALIVIDGVPIINATNNSGNQTTGRGGYDYGNAAMDLNPDDIESVNVLKGSAATALYGSRAGTGAIIITTKKGKSKKGLGVSINSSLMVSSVDEKTLPVYQDKYGAGYGPYYDTPYFSLIDFNNDGTADDWAVPFTEDASYGAAFDPNLMVYQWNSIFPQLSTYGQKTPWVAAKNNPNSLWQIGTSTSNSFAFGGSTDTSNFRFSFTNFLQEGNLPNSNLKKNTIALNAMHKFSDKLTLNGGIQFINTKAKGRYGTGYDSNNPMQSFRQWWQTNVDIQEQKEAYFATRENITWNTNSHTDLTPIYTDNVYWVLYENYQNDSRNRFIYNTSLDYKINSWLSATAKFSRDGYVEKQEERTNVGSSNVSRYLVRNINQSEINYDLMLNFNKKLSDNISLDGNAGWNLRVEKFDNLTQATNGGLVTPRLYTLGNSVNPLTTNEIAPFFATKKVDGLYARANFGFYDTYFIEGTIRTDRSSALPEANNRYYYPSVSSSFVFSNLIKADWLTFGKLRANWAQNFDDTAVYNIYNTYLNTASFNGQPTATNPGNLKNPNLNPEEMKETELGLEMQFFKRRFGFDFSWYNRNRINLITPIDVSTSTGAAALVLNAGDVVNKGIELFVNATPLKFDKFSWDVKVNFAKNENEVIRLAEGIDYYNLASVQGGVSIGASVGDPFGVIRGRDFIYAPDGQKVIGSNGYYLRTNESNKVLGNINPDWTGGVKNTFNLGNVSLSFLIDVKKGGDVFSLDTYYGYATGLYDFTAGLNELGNPVRDSRANGGGVILQGVKQTGVDGSGNPIYVPNDIRADATTYANPWGYVRTPQAAHVYDASFVKLREASLSYVLPKQYVENIGINNLTISLIGRNLWIIHKNTPYTDPEAGLSAGNIQGYQSGAYPAVREIGASVKFDF